MFNDAQSKVIRVEAGFLIDSGRMMCCDLLVGRGVGSFFGCHVLLAGDQDLLVEYK